MTMLLEQAETTAMTPAVLAPVDLAVWAPDLCIDASCVYCCGPETD